MKLLEWDIPSPQSRHDVIRNIAIVPAQVELLIQLSKHIHGKQVIAKQQKIVVSFCAGEKRAKIHYLRTA